MRASIFLPVPTFNRPAMQWRVHRHHFASGIGSSVKALLATHGALENIEHRLGHWVGARPSSLRISPSLASNSAYDASGSSTSSRSSLIFDEQRVAIGLHAGGQMCAWT